MKKMRPVYFLCFAVALLSFGMPQAVSAQVEGSYSPAAVKTEPGKVVTINFLVTNHDRHEIAYEEKFGLPAGWRIIIPESAFTLQPGERQGRLFTFLVPSACPAGYYFCTYTLLNSGAGEVLRRIITRIHVTPKMKIETVVEEKPDTVIAGDEYRLKLKILNAGNCPAKINYFIKSDPDILIKLDPPEMLLKAGKAQMLELSVKTDEKTNRFEKHLVAVKIEAREFTDNSPKEQKISEFQSAEGVGENTASRNFTAGFFRSERTVLVGVIPRITSDGSSLYAVPSQLRLMAVGGTQSDQCQLEFSGSGCFGEEDEDKLSFLLRSSNCFDPLSPLTLQDYYLNYCNRLFSFNLGRQRYFLSGLTMDFNSITGAGLNLHHGGFNWGVLYLTDFPEETAGTPWETGAGAFLAYDINRFFGLKANYLAKNESLNHHNIYSLEAKIKPAGKTELDLEYALGESGDSVIRDGAYRLNLSCRYFKPLWFTLEAIDAGPDFLGNYQNLNRISAAMNFSMGDRFKGELSYRADQSYTRAGPSMDIPDSETSYKANFTVSLPFYSHLCAEYETLRGGDLFLPERYNFMQKRIKVRLGKTFPWLTMNLFAEEKETDDLLPAGQDKDTKHYGFTFYSDLIQGQTYSLYASIGDPDFLLNGEGTNMAGFSGSWRINEGFDFNLYYQIKKFLLYAEEKSVYYNFNYTAPSGLSVRMGNRWTKYEEDDHMDGWFLLICAVPLDLPAGKKPAGAIRGKVYDGEGPARTPVRNAVIRANGFYAVTDKNGEYSFPSLAPGTYCVWMEKCPLGPDKISLAKSPVMIKVEKGSSKTMDFAMVTSCRISGKITFYTLDPEKDGGKKYDAAGGGLLVLGADQDNGLQEESLVEAGILANILVEIASGEEAFQQLTDENGCFSFSDLRPGKWTVKISGANLPPNSYLEKEEITVDLKPGEETMLDARVLPLVRQVEMIDEGVVKEEKKK
ncbi:MAG: hypothetical protein ACM3WV_09500 [Bacillota bacterium]